MTTAAKERNAAVSLDVPQLDMNALVIFRAILVT